MQKHIMELSTRRSYMGYWHFTPEEKEILIDRLTEALPALRGAVKATQDEIANAVGISRQTYNAIEMQKRKMSWNTYMALILFFDYNPYSHYTMRQLDAFPYQLDECWLSGKVEQVGGGRFWDQKLLSESYKFLKQQSND